MSYTESSLMRLNKEDLVRMLLDYQGKFNNIFDELNKEDLVRMLLDYQGKI